LKFGVLGAFFPRFFGLRSNLLLEGGFWIRFVSFSRIFLLIARNGKKEAVKSKGLGFVGLGYEVPTTSAKST